MSDVILEDVKQMIGVDPSHIAFDRELIMHINSVFVILRQMGIGPQDKTFSISGTETWNDYISSDFENIQEVKTYVAMKTKLIFDPPTNAGSTEALNKVIAELEWRLNVQADYPKGFE